MNAGPAAQLVRLDVGGEARWVVRTEVGDAPLPIRAGDVVTIDIPAIGTLTNPVVLVGRDLDQESG